MEPDAQCAPPRTQGAPRLPRLRLALPPARLQGAVARRCLRILCLRASVPPRLRASAPLRLSASASLCLRASAPLRLIRAAPVLPGVVARDAAAALRLPRQGGTEPRLGRPASPAPGGRCTARRSSVHGRPRQKVWGGIELRARNRYHPRVWGRCIAHASTSQRQTPAPRTHTNTSTNVPSATVV